ncbi:MAG: N-succinylarginine dihydrolase [Bdellovibrionaceae bacterium]|nr:N-succinylarginine dihydrolase [Pseudobdellovibrionaceae bacterium]
MKTIEANFDGLIGPTHNYAGLSLGNIASMGNKKQISNPREAAIQGLNKMKSLVDLGFVQGVLAPQSRPDISTLRRLGFSGTKDIDVISKAAKIAPDILKSLSSASSMWTANAATISPSADTQDAKVHITPANLVNKFHRFIESPSTVKILKSTFCNVDYFVHHKPLPAHESFGDEGAANHTRLCRDYGDTGVELFVYGRFAEVKNGPHPKLFPARQTLEACEAIVRLHQLKKEKVVFAQQNPEVIDQGVFHNDVIAVGNRNCFFYHEEAFLNKEKVRTQILNSYGSEEFFFIEVKNIDVSVSDAVNSYLFNSQLLSIDDNKMLLLVPEEARNTESVWQYLNELVKNKSQPISEIIVKDVKQSMKNGGGPACLRLRVVLNEKEILGVNPKTLLNDNLYKELINWVNKYYRDQLSEEDLADPQLFLETKTALDVLTQILDLGSVYDFQLNESQSS